MDLARDWVLKLDLPNPGNLRTACASGSVRLFEPAATIASGNPAKVIFRRR
jgi:hypothetical protein